jgi:hypothetical protein
MIFQLLYLSYNGTYCPIAQHWLKLVFFVQQTFDSFSINTVVLILYVLCMMQNSVCPPNLTFNACEVRTLNFRSQWLCGLRSAAARLLQSWVRIAPGAWMFFCCVCVLSDRGLCDDLITRPDESYRLWRVVVCDQETSWTRRP